MSWYSNKGREIGKDELLMIHQESQEGQISEVDLHYKYVNYYSTICSALLTAFVAGMLQFYKESISLVLLVIPIIVIIIAEHGKGAVDRFYQRFLEHIVISAKIENMLGLDSQIQIKGEPIPSKLLWPNDEVFMPKRNVDDRFEYIDSENFIKERMKGGANSKAHRIFSIFEILSIVLSLLLIGSFCLASFVNFT